MAKTMLLIITAFMFDALKIENVASEQSLDAIRVPWLNGFNKINLLFMGVAGAKE